MNPGKIRRKIVITAGLMLMTALPQGVFAADGALMQAGGGTWCLQQNGSAVCYLHDTGSLHRNSCRWNYLSCRRSRFCGFESWMDNKGEDAEKDEIILQPGNGENGNNGSGSAAQPENSGNGSADGMTQPETGGSGNADGLTRPENGDTGNSGIQQSSSASQVISLVNQERSAAGLSSLSYDPELTELAQLKAEDMAKNGYFSHQSPTYGSAFDMMRSAGLTYRSAGENIARGQKTAAAVMNSWMNSQGHKENILSTSYTSIGVGYAADSSGRICWVQMFRG